MSAFVFISERNLPPGFPVINQNPELKVVEKGTKALLGMVS